MALEIERRFLVCGEAWKAHVRWSAALRQGYLVSGATGPTLRVRSDGEGSAWLTLKFPAAGIARQEFEYAIPPADAEALLLQCPEALEKNRHGLDLPGGDWVLDVFEGGNAPLRIAEVELEQADQAVVIPPWCAVEISGDGRFSNAALARHPFVHWSAEERAPWLQAMGLPAASRAS
ncbi:MAG: CYTH domain-containing protein [Vulcanococcus sp.]